MTETPREVMNRVDGIRARASALDHIIIRMRVREPVTQRGRHFFSRGKPHQQDVEVHLTAQEDQLFYEWAHAQKLAYEAEARRLEATLRVVDE